MSRGRRLKVLAIAAVLSMVVVPGAGLLAVQRAPEWFRPPGLSSQQIDRVRSEVEQTFEIVTQKLLAGHPFSISITARQINEMLSAQRVLWPTAASWMGSRLRTPCVGIAGDGILLGAELRWWSARSVLSLGLTPRIHGDTLELEVNRLRAGCLPVPANLLSSAVLAPGGELASLAAEENWSARLLADLLHHRAVTVANEFQWPNGCIPFRISTISLSGDRLTLQITPAGGQLH